MVDHLHPAFKPPEDAITGTEGQRAAARRNKAPLTDLINALLNPPPSFRKVLDLIAQLMDQPLRPVPKHPRQIQTRLTPDQTAQLLERYQKGEKAYRLAEEFGIHRGTVAAILERAGLRRPRSMTVGERAEAITLYAQGWSCARIGERLGRDGTTVWHALKAAGVKLRDQHSRES